jgi:hypothetical protein
VIQPLDRKRFHSEEQQAYFHRRDDAFKYLISRGVDWERRRFGRESDLLFDLRCTNGHVLARGYDPLDGNAVLLVATYSNSPVPGGGTNPRGDAARRGTWLAEDSYPECLLIAPGLKNSDGEFGYLAAKRWLHCRRCPAIDLPSDEALLALADAARARGRKITHTLPGRTSR